jgi:hypothetical protein
LFWAVERGHLYVATVLLHFDHGEDEESHQCWPLPPAGSQTDLDDVRLAASGGIVPESADTAGAQIGDTVSKPQKSEADENREAADTISLSKGIANRAATAKQSKDKSVKSTKATIRSTKLPPISSSRGYDERTEDLADAGQPPKPKSGKSVHTSNASSKAKALNRSASDHSASSSASKIQSAKRVAGSAAKGKSEDTGSEDIGSEADSDDNTSVSSKGSSVGGRQSQATKSNKGEIPGASSASSKSGKGRMGVPVVGISLTSDDDKPNKVARQSSGGVNSKSVSSRSGKGASSGIVSTKSGKRLSGKMRQLSISTRITEENDGFEDEDEAESRRATEAAAMLLAEQQAEEAAREAERLANLKPPDPLTWCNPNLAIEVGHDSFSCLNYGLTSFNKLQNSTTAIMTLCRICNHAPMKEEDALALLRLLIKRGAAVNVRNTVRKLWLLKCARICPLQLALRRTE